MRDIKTERDRAIGVMKEPPRVETKLDALDALDRLALNCSGWFSERVLDNLTEARKSIIIDRWQDALLTLEEARTSMEQFLRVLRDKQDADEQAKDAAERAAAELNQAVLVLSWLDHRPEPE